jgi:hypothetical protein
MSDDVYCCIASFFGKFHSEANFEQENDESQSNQPSGSKYHRRPAAPQLAKRLTNCAHDELALGQ